VALRTVEDSKKVQSLFLSSDQGGGHIKNLYLRDNKKQNILLVVEQDRKIDLKSLPTLIGTGRLSFGSADRLLENLGVRPGAVTPLAMITGVKQGVKLFIDSDLKKCLKLYMHPLVNDRTLEMGLAGLQVFFKKVQVAPIWLDLKS
jgi:Ala-tRNA(Pro) deacylase